MKKKYLIIVLILIIVLGGIFFLIFNKDSNKLKRYLKKEGYKCNSSICTKEIPGGTNQINYKKGVYTINSQEYTLEIVNSRATINVKNSNEPCVFAKQDVKNLTTFTEDDTTPKCLVYLEITNKEVGQFQGVIVRSKANLEKLSK